jgi:hypothetical protein
MYVVSPYAYSYLWGYCLGHVGQLLSSVENYAINSHEQPLSHT